MELNDLYTADAHEEGAEMQVKDENGEPTDCFITFVGVDSHTWRKILKDAQHKVLSGEVSENDALADAAITWRGFTHEGKEVPFSRNAVKVLLDQAPYIARQADRFIAKRSNFTKA